MCGSYDVVSREAKIYLPSNFDERYANYFFRLFLPYIFIQDDIGVFIHASGLIKEDKVFIFIGDKGFGKSTIVKHTDDKKLLSDEMILITKDLFTEKYYAWGTPFVSSCGEIGANIKVELSEVFFIEKSSLNRLERINSGETIKLLLAQCSFGNKNLDVYNKKVVEQCLDISFSLNCYKLFFKRDISFWDMLIKNI